MGYGFNGFGGGGGMNMNALMQQARKMQEQMQKAQEELENAEVIGKAGGEMVTVVMNGKKETLVAVDNVGAGIGEIVLVATGSAARIGCKLSDAPVDAAIVGIVDSGVGLSGV